MWMQVSCKLQVVATFIHMEKYPKHQNITVEKKIMLLYSNLALMWSSVQLISFNSSLSFPKCWLKRSAVVLEGPLPLTQLHLSTFLITQSIYSVHQNPLTQILKPLF